MAPRTLDTEDDIREGLEALLRLDGRLEPVIATAGEVKVRRSPAGFVGLAAIIVSQQLSAASADAIWRRVEAAFPKLTADIIADAGDDALRGAGLSGPKIRTLRAVAEAVRAGLDLDRLAVTPADEAHAALTEIKGIGPWTADIYLLFCLGHADIFPAGDLALRNAVGTALALPVAPSVAEVDAIARVWSPWRGVAAILFWSYYHAMRKAGRGAVAGRADETSG